MISPSRSPVVGDRCEEEDLCTGKEYLRPVAAGAAAANTPSMTQHPASGTSSPTRRLPACVDIKPTSHGIADPPSDAIENTTPPNRRAAAPYHRENQEI